MPYAAGTIVNIYSVPLHIAVCIEALVLESPRNVVLVSPTYAASCIRAFKRSGAK